MKSNEKSRRGRKPTIIDVAREAHVGVMTVSRVINNNKTVRPGTYAKVMNAIKKVGYQPNDAARVLKGMRTRTIGFIIPDLSDFFSNCFHEVQGIAMQRAYQTLVVATGRNIAVENQQLESMANRRIAGLLIVTSGGDSNQLKTLLSAGIPVVALDRPIEGLRTDAVLVENREGAECGVRHLIEHGHKKIACIAFEQDAYTVRERINGYENAMRSAGLKPLLYDKVDALDSMEQLVSQWTEKNKDRPTAVFTAQRISSIRLIQAMHRCGLRAPGDLAVVGFDDFELAEALGTPLTVVAQSPTDLARTAADLLFKQIDRVEQGEAIELGAARILFPTTLIIRSSCGCSA